MSLEVTIKETSIVEVTPQEIENFKITEQKCIEANADGSMSREWLESLSDYEIAQEIAKKKVLKHQMEAIVNLEFLEINTFIDETGEFLK